MSSSTPRATIGGIVVQSHFRTPNSPPNSASLKPLYQWWSAPAVICPRPSSCVATLSLINSALLCQRVLLEFVLASTTESFCAPTPPGDRNEMISPGEWPGHL